jgi:hypothetical protein
MVLVRRRLPWLLSLWLVCQCVGLAAPIVLAAAGSAPVEELCTCAGGDHETCPMHHGTQTDGTAAPCGVRAACAPVDVALLSMAGGAGVLPAPIQFNLPCSESPVIAFEPSATALAVPHDTPPPRLAVC